MVIRQVDDRHKKRIILTIIGGNEMRIDAGGKQCPIPVIMAKKELEAGEQDVGQP